MTPSTLASYKPGYNCRKMLPPACQFKAGLCSGRKGWCDRAEKKASQRCIFGIQHSKLQMRLKRRKRPAVFIYAVGNSVYGLCCGLTTSVHVKPKTNLLRHIKTVCLPGQIMRIWWADMRQKTSQQISGGIRLVLREPSDETGRRPDFFLISKLL